MLLKILLLSKQFVVYDDGHSGLPFFIPPENADFIQLISKYLRVEDLEYSYYLFPAAICPSVVFSNESHQKQTIKSINTLTVLADSIDIEELHASLSESAYYDYKNLDFVNELDDYRGYVGFVLVTQWERLLRSINRHRLYDTMQFYIDEQISWPMTIFLASRIIEIDPEKSKGTVRDLLDTDIWSSKRALIKSIISSAFYKHHDFLYDWYFKIQDTKFERHPHDRDIILHELQQGGKDRLGLYKKILQDNRFKVYETTLGQQPRWDSNCRSK
jgi:ACT domain-containing protein